MSVRRGIGIQLGVASLVCVLNACGSSDVTAPLVPGALVAHSSLSFSNIAGRATLISVRVTSTDDKPIQGITIAFTITRGAGTVTPSSAVTGENGLVTVSWTLDRVAGPNTLVASLAAPHEGTAPPVTFSAAGLVGPAMRVAFVAGEDQTGIVGKELPTTPSVRVTDANDNPIAGATVTVAVTGGGTVTPDTLTTSLDGHAPMRWTLGTVVGPNTLTASVQGLAPAVLTATSVADQPARMTATSGDAQEDTSGATLPLPLTVRVVDQYDNPAVGAEVVFQTASPGGIVSPVVAKASATGHASTRWSLGQNLGPDSALATINGSGVTAVRFSATVRTQPLHAIDVSSGHMHSCAVLSSRRVYCWGYNAQGQLGNGTTTDSDLAVPISSNRDFTDVETGMEFTCALDTGGETYCWGRNSWGGVGDGTQFNIRVNPTRVLGVPAFTRIAVGGQFACGQTADGRVYCWGFLLGASHIDPPAPVEVSASVRFAAISASEYRLCGVDVTGTTHCMMSVIDSTYSTTPFARYRWAPRSHNLHSRATSFAVRGDTACAATDHSELHCFPFTASGMGGVFRLLENAGAIVAAQRGWSSTCVTTNGPMYCWGDNYWGQLGVVPGPLPAEVHPLAPAMVAEPRFHRVSGGSYHTCGLADSSLVYCWGSGNAGQLGDGPHAPFFARHTPGLAQRR